MKYQKPEVQVISAATTAIESVDCKYLSIFPDHITQTPMNTGPAYEADE